MISSGTKNYQAPISTPRYDQTLDIIHITKLFKLKNLLHPISLTKLLPLHPTKNTVKAIAQKVKQNTNETKNPSEISRGNKMEHGTKLPKRDKEISQRKMKAFDN